MAGAGPGRISMQSTGHGAKHSSQPVQRSTMTVCRYFRGADDGIDRAGRQAARAADAAFLIDPGHERRRLDAVGRIQRKIFATEQAGERLDRGTAPGGALIDRRFAGRDGGGIRSAPA